MPGGHPEPPKALHELWRPEIIDEIVRKVEVGNYRLAAAMACGVKRTTWENWMLWGRSGFEPYAELGARLDAAEALAHCWHVENMRNHATGQNWRVLCDKDGNEKKLVPCGDWRPSTWWLSRKFAHDWSEKATLQQAAETAIQQEEIELSIPLLEQYLSKVGYRLLPLAEEPGRDTELNNGTKQKGRSKGRRG